MAKRPVKTALEDDFAAAKVFLDLVLGSSASPALRLPLIVATAGLSNAMTSGDGDREGARRISP